MKKGFQFVVLLLIIVGIGFSQAVVDGRYSIVTNDGSTFAIKVQLKTSTGADDLGTTTLQFDFNNAALSFPASPTAGVDYTFHNFSGGLYGTATITRPLANKISVNIELLVDGSGTVVTNTYMDVATINFTTTNPVASSNLTWALMEVYDGDNATLWTNGLFESDNSTLPVEISSFNAIAKGRFVELTWKTATETNNNGFEVERKNDGTEWTKVGFVEGNGTTASEHSYSYKDATEGGATYSYRLKQIDRDGNFSYSSTVEATTALSAEDYKLSSNYPNPFNPSTKFTFAVKNSAPAAVKVFNALGQEVASLFNGVAEADKMYEVNFNATGLASGTYFYMLRTNDRYEIKKMLLMK